MNIAKNRNSYGWKDKCASNVYYLKAINIFILPPTFTQLTDHRMTALMEVNNK